MQPRPRRRELAPGVVLSVLFAVSLLAPTVAASAPFDPSYALALSRNGELDCGTAVTLTISLVGGRPLLAYTVEVEVQKPGPAGTAIATVAIPTDNGGNGD